MKKLILALVVILSGCNSSMVNVLIHGRKTPIKVVVWGQSNAARNIMWDAMVTKLQESDNWEITYINVAMGNTASYDWATDWRYYGLPQKLKEACKAYQPQFVLSIQGESDSGTPKEDYYNNYVSIRNMIRSVSPNSQCFIARCSYGVYGQGDPRGAQDQLINEVVFMAGPDVDKFRIPEYSEGNGLHFNEAGDREIGKLWAEIVLPHL